MFDREETFIGVACVAAPVLGPDGTAVAAVSLAGPTHRFQPDGFADRIRAVTSEISRELQVRGEETTARIAVAIGAPVGRWYGPRGERLGVPAVEVTGLVKRYGPLEAVRGIDFTVERGEVFALLGSNTN